MLLKPRRLRTKQHSHTTHSDATENIPIQPQPRAHFWFLASQLRPHAMNKTNLNTGGTGHMKTRFWCIHHRFILDWHKVSFKGERSHERVQIKCCSSSFPPLWIIWTPRSKENTQLRKWMEFHIIVPFASCDLKLTLAGLKFTHFSLKQH